MFYQPQTHVEVVGVETPEFNPDVGIYTHYPEVASRFNHYFRRHKGAPKTTTSLLFSIEGALLEDIPQSKWEIGTNILADETDFYNDDHHCPTLRCGYKGYPSFSAHEALRKPAKWPRVARFMHWLAHCGYNPALAFAREASIKVYQGIPESVVSVPDNEFIAPGFRIFYAFSTGPLSKIYADKMERLAQVAIGVLEGDKVACTLHRYYWKALLQWPLFNLDYGNDPVWRYFAGLPVNRSFTWAKRDLERPNG